MKTLLYVDDSADDRLLVQRACRRARVSFGLQTLESGVEAIRYLNGEGEFADPTSGQRQKKNPICGTNRTGLDYNKSTERIVMNEVLDVLLVDDNEYDRALVARELSREFGDCRFHHVIDGSHFAQELESAPRALVVTDYQLGWSDGLAVFMAVKARWPECPIGLF